MMRIAVKVFRRLAPVKQPVLLAVILVVASLPAGAGARAWPPAGQVGALPAMTRTAVASPGAGRAHPQGIQHLARGDRGSLPLQGRLLVSGLRMAQGTTSLTVSGDDPWDAEFGVPGMDGSVVRELVVGRAGQLYAGGDFATAGGVPAQRVAYWNGTNWAPLGDGMDQPVLALALDGQGNLYAGGDFTTAGSRDASHVAMWDGANWLPLGSGLDGTVRALAVDANRNLYAGGHFTKAGSLTVNYIAKWNGTTWSAVGGGMNNAVLALAIEGSTLYVGGFFDKAGGTTAKYVAKWEDSGWSPLGDGMDSHVYALAAAGGVLYAGGAFTSPAAYISKWNGTTWSSLDTGMNGAVAALALAGTKVYAGGYFGNAGGASASHIAMWDGSTWSPLGSGIGGAVEALALGSCGTLYAGGWFEQAGGKPSARIARWRVECSTYLPLVLRSLREGVPPPAPPSGLVAAALSPDTIQLDWTDNSANEDEFIVENSPDGVHFAYYGTSGGPDVTRVWDVELQPGTTHCYRIYARNAHGDSNPSNTACATTQSSGPPAPLSNLTAQVVSSTRILLTWTNNSSCDGYNVYESIDGAPFDPNNPTGTVTPGNLPGAYVDVWAGHAYAYRVAPHNSFGESPYADAPVSNIVNTPSSSSATITKFVNNTVYPVISLRIDGAEQFPAQPQGIPPATYFQRELAVGSHNYRAATGFWSGGQRVEMYVYQGSFNQQSGVAGQVQFNNPTIGQILTRFGASGYYVGDYWTGTIPNSAAFRFYSNGTYTFYRNGVTQGSGTYSLSSYPGNFLLTFQVAGYQNAQGQMDERTGHFYMRNGPTDWPTIQYNYDGP